MLVTLPEPQYLSIQKLHQVKAEVYVGPLCLNTVPVSSKTELGEVSSSKTYSLIKFEKIL